MTVAEPDPEPGAEADQLEAMPGVALQWIASTDRLFGAVLRDRHNLAAAGPLAQ